MQMCFVCEKKKIHRTLRKTEIAWPSYLFLKGGRVYVEPSLLKHILPFWEERSQRVIKRKQELASAEVPASSKSMLWSWSRFGRNVRKQDQSSSQSFRLLKRRQNQHLHRLTICLHYRHDGTFSSSSGGRIRKTVLQNRPPSTSACPIED